MKKIIVCFVAFTMLHITAYSKPKTPKFKRPKKIIFLIGDGMGLAQITGAMADNTGVNAFERFPITGLSKTKSSDNYVTDSGAGATVFSIGKKTYNGAIGVDSTGKEIDGLFEMIKDKGWATGVVVTSSVTHATPASFYAHVASRKTQDDIAEFLIRNHCDIAIGGGIKFFKDRKDKRDLLEELAEKGYKTIVDSINEIKPVDAKKLIYLLAYDGMKKEMDGRGDYLKKATEIAIHNLSKNDEGYFLMVEGSQIDWGGHDNDFQYMKTELLDFNQTINAVLDYAAKDKNTLVVVTADHETGGLSLIENKENKGTFKVNYSTNGHSGIMVPVFAFGPGAELFSGIYENTEIHDKFKTLLKLK